MQLLQRDVDGATAPFGKKNAAERLRAKGISNPKRMEVYQSIIEDPEALGQTGLLVTDDLTRETGLMPEGFFYRLPGTGLGVDEDFRQAFGKSQDAVYARYRLALFCKVAFALLRQFRDRTKLNQRD